MEKSIEMFPQIEWSADICIEFILQNDAFEV